MRHTAILPRPTRAAVLGFCVALCWVVMSSPTAATAADEPLLRGLLGERDDLLNPSAKAELEVSTRLIAEKLAPGETATLLVTVTVPEGYYIYSTNRSFGGATRITFPKGADKAENTPGFEPLEDEFRADRKPKVDYEPLLEREIEKFYGSVTWSRRFKIAEGADVEKLSLSGSLTGQYCSSGPAGQCIPIRPARQFTAALEEAKLHSYSFEDRPVQLNKPMPAVVFARLQPEDAKPGETVTLEVGLRLDEGWHTYSLTQKEGQAATPSELKIAFEGLKPLDDGFTPDPAPKKKSVELPGETVEHEVHHEEVVWTRKFEVLPAGDGKTGEGYGVAGKLLFAVCREGCLPPKTVEFRLGPVSPETVAAVDRDDSADRKLAIQVSEGDESRGLMFYLVSAFLGGLILNVMPCVLPVLAIKVMSFVQQAGESRSRIFALNASYALGVLSVFLLLATLATGIATGGEKLGWGGLFRSSEFNLVMACIVFAMGLSLLGVFEIPIPGLVGSAAGSAHREGLPGAFLTGIFATLLATPCSGPFLGATLGWSVRQPTEVTYLVWTVMGLGMASPYVLFGMFPGAIAWLPKPGMWMVRFKEFSGFVLMGTVIFIIYFLEESYRIPLLVMLLGIALGLWMIGNLYHHTSPVRHKMTIRVTALALTAGICLFGYRLAQKSDAATELPWVAFSEQELERARQSGKTVLIDFTADWCLTCKANELLALNTADTLALVKEHDIVPLYADYTNENEEIKKWLDEFDSISVPLTVIFPAGDLESRIIMRDTYSKGALLENLKRAVGQTKPVAVVAPADQPSESSASSAGARLPWVPFSDVEMERALASPNALLVAFTHDLALSSAMIERTALNIPETLELIRQHDIVPIHADCTQGSKESDRWLKRFESATAPLTVIFPRGERDKPILLRDSYTAETLHARLKEAVGIPKSTSPAATVANTPMTVE
ncbi:MAG: thioredoxin family protein [Planctomycetaceae bacterium]